MKGRPIVLEFQGEPRSLSEIGRMIGVSPRAMANRYARYAAGKCDISAVFAPPDERMKHRGNWEVGDVVRVDDM